MPNVKIITDDSFNREVLENDQPVLVDFTATWCGPCQQLAPVLDSFAENREDLGVAKIDIGDGDNPESQEKYAIQAFPTLLLFRGGNVAGMAMGVMDEDTLSGWVDEHLENDPANDIAVEDFKGYAEEYMAKVQEARNEQMQKMQINVGRKLAMGGSALRVAGGLTLFAVSSGIAATMLGGFIACQAALTGYNAYTNKDEMPLPYEKRTLRMAFNAATLTAGAALVMAPTSGFLAAAAAMGLGGYLAFSGGMGLFNDIKGLAKGEDPVGDAIRQFKDKGTAAPENTEPENDKQKGNVVSAAFDDNASGTASNDNDPAKDANDPECKDGTCELPQQPKRSDPGPHGL